MQGGFSMDDHLLARLSNIECRIANIELGLDNIYMELGKLTSPTKNGSNQTAVLLNIIRYVIFPLVVVIGATVGVKLI